ncbi:Protein bicaudal D [Trichinella spiralis]|uniref:Protein bicaudal D n=1 Tax=Trichinella spiralis TaxID=6334 RepID=A0A0V1B277_TRISP|nr:Protein bicaudal D [Trichinella spiralis]
MTNPLSVESHLRHHFNNLDSTKRVQIDFDSMKFELEKLYEEMQVLRFQSDEASELKEIAERQVEEALRSLQQEREQRLALKKEVDQLKNAELFNSNMSNLAQSVFGMQILVDDKVSSPAMFKQLQASMEEDGESDHYQPMDLFSEMHGAQVKKLELELSSANRQREEMQKQLDVCMRQLNCILFEEANRLVDQIVDVVNSSVADVMCLICGNSPGSFKASFKDDNNISYCSTGTLSFSELAMAFLNVPVVTSTLEVQILMLLIAFAAMIAFLVLCGWCSKGERDGNEQAPPLRQPQPLYPCYPPGQVYQQQMGAPGFMPMPVPNYTAGPPPTIPTQFPAAAPAPPPASVESEDGVDPELEGMAKGQSARDTMADVPSIKDHLPPKRKPF